MFPGSGAGCTNEKSAFCASSHEFEKIGGGPLASMAQYLFPSLDLPLLMYITPQGAN